MKYSLLLMIVILISSGFVIAQSNSPPNPPTDHVITQDSGILTISWKSGIDPDGDDTYDQVKLPGEPVFGNPESSAESPIFTLANGVSSYEIRTCEIPYNICSDWIEIQTNQCTDISPECPNLDELSDFIRQSRSPRFLDAVFECNGIVAEEDFFVSVDYNSVSKKLSIFGKDFSFNNLDECPWCNDNIKNYDETGVDCGGSCPSCDIKSRKDLWNLLLWILTILMGTAEAYGFGYIDTRKAGGELVKKLVKYE